MGKINNNGIIYVAISLALILAFVVTVGANAGVSFQELFANALAKVVGPQVVDNLNLIAPTEDIRVGAISGTSVDYPVQFTEGLITTVSKDVIFNASTTLNVSGPEANDVGASFYATKDIICDDVWVDIKTAIGGATTMAYSLSAGTTTKTAGGSWTNTSTATIMASSTVGVAVTSKLVGMADFSNAAKPGSYYGVQGTVGEGFGTSTKFLVNAGEYLNLNYKTQSATSSASFENNAAKATFHANCWAR